MMYISQTIMMYTLNLYTTYLKKLEEKTKETKKTKKEELRKEKKYNYKLSTEWYRRYK